MANSIEPIREVEVRMMLPIDVYLAAERKATPLDLTAGKLLAAYFTKVVRRDGSADGPGFTMKIAGRKLTGYDALSQPQQLEFRRLAVTGATGDKLAHAFNVSAQTALSWRRKLIDTGVIALPAHPKTMPAGYRSLSAADQATFQQMSAEGATGAALGARFKVSGVTALAWRARLVEIGAVVLPTAADVRHRNEVPAPGTEKQRRVRLGDEEQAELTRMIARGATAPAIIERFGISLGSVTNWRRRLAGPAAALGDQLLCQWCGADPAGVAFLTDDRRYPASSCGLHGHHFAADDGVDSAAA